MKVKLLKKVRKRFSIIHTPDGIFLDNEYCNYNLFRLIDKKSHYYSDIYCQLKRNTVGMQFCSDVFETEEECIDYLLGRILKRLRYEGYTSRKDRSIMNNQNKIWYNQK